MALLIYWHKRDYRLFDNDALLSAYTLSQQEQTPFIPIMGIETDLLQNDDTSYEFSEFQQYGILSAMLPLFQNYMHHGVKPLIFHESIISFLSKIQDEHGITYLVSHEEPGTYGTYRRDKAVAQFCREHEIIWLQIPHNGIVRRLKSRDERSKHMKAYIDSAVLPIPDFTKTTHIDIQDTHATGALFTQFLTLKNTIASHCSLQECSEKSGIQALQSFIEERARGYRGGISSPNSALLHGSRLSQYLAYGSISVRHAHNVLSKAASVSDDKRLTSGILAALQRLSWRGHFVQRIEDDSTMPQQAIHSEFNTISYTHKQDLFEAYKQGMTGEVLIDACIRCLKATGFINFRMRALLVSYAVFGLDLDWRECGKFLATLFLDYEPGIHWSQMQMQAGVTGINTIRVYSPHKQLLDQDPLCIFVKKWIPELADIRNEDILMYTDMSLSELTDGKYPDPIIPFKEVSKELKVKTFGIRKSASKEIAKKVYTKHGSRKPRIIKKKEKVKVENTLFS